MNLDDDDFFLKTKIEKLVNLMESLNNEWLGVYSWFIQEKPRKVIQDNAEGNLSIPLLKCKIKLAGGSSLLLKLDAVKSIAGFNIFYKRHEDWEFILRICQNGKIKLFKEPLFVVIKSGPRLSRISPENHLKLKIKYLKDFNNLISSYGSKNVKKIYVAQFFEVIYHFLTRRKISKSLKLLYKFFKFSPIDVIIETFNFFRRKLYLK